MKIFKNTGNITENLNEKNISIWTTLISIMFFPVNIVVIKQHLSPSITVGGILMTISFFALAKLVRLITTPDEKLPETLKIFKPIIIFLWICVKITSIALLIGFLHWYPGSSSIGLALGISIIPTVLLLKSMGKLIVDKQKSH